MKNNSSKIFLVWPREDSLSQELATAIGFKLLTIRAKHPQAFFLSRYLEQSLETYRWLRANKPSLVYIQNPPLMAVLVVYFFTLFYPQTKFLIDNHSVYFKEMKWKLFHWLARPLHKKALLNTFHNFWDLNKMSYLKNVLEVQFINPHYNFSRLRLPLEDQFLENALQIASSPILMVNRFAKDDDYQTVFNVAKRNPGRTFFITGDYRKISFLKKDKLPLNLILTGYLKHSEFLKLMFSCSLVLCLTLREETILWSPREAMALGKVFLTSKTEALEKYYKEAGIYCRKKNSLDLEEKISFAENNKGEQRLKIRKFLEKDQERQQKQLNSLRIKIKEFSSKKKS